MPKKSGSQSQQPVVPQVSVETWKALLAAADDFRRLAPWEWMHDSHVIGLRHPGTKEVLLASVLGRMRTIFALLVYRNETGHRWLLNTIMRAGDSGGFEREDTAFEQDLVKVEFVRKRELDKQDQSILAACGYAPAEKRGPVWPLFRSLVPGGFPWHMTQAEAETLLVALPRVTAAARWMRDHPDAWNNHLEGDVAFLPDAFDPALELRSEHIEWQPMIPPPEPPPKRVALDEATLTQLSGLPVAKGFHLEMDVTYAAFPIADRERPFFPKFAIAVERASGLITGFHLGELADQDGAAALRTVLCNTLAELACKPETFRVQRPRVAAMLSDVTAALGVPVKLEGSLRALQSALESLERRFA